VVVVEPPDPHEEPTRILRRPCIMCSGTGMACGVLEEPWVTFCGCMSGRRLQCAFPEGAFPVRFSAAAWVADRLGMGPAGGDF